MHATFVRALAIGISLLWSSFVSAEQFSVVLVENEGVEIQVAEMELDDEGYQIHWDDEKFGDFFLSMRPFKCLEGSKKLWCRVPYPYPIKRSVADGDLTDLEYDTLFVWKNASDYGIDMWNGVYYQIVETDLGYVGTMHDIDMGRLAVPPEAGELRPVREIDLEEADGSSHWLPKLEIRRN